MISIPRTVSLYVSTMWHYYLRSALLYSKGPALGPIEKVETFVQEEILSDCQAFYNATWEFLRNPTFHWPAEQVGHLFALERSGLGGGFKDVERSTPEIREKLAKVAQSFSKLSLVKQDGQITRSLS